MMFTNHCTECDKVQLIFLSQVTGIHDSGHGSVVNYTCWCGAAQEWAVDGVHAAPSMVAA